MEAASLIKSSHSDNDPIKVRSKPLLDILHEFDINKVDCMKIDVEGYEDKVLVPFFRDATSEYLPKLIVIEHCNNNDWDIDLFEFLRSKSYSKIAKTRANTIMSKSI